MFFPDSSEYLCPSCKEGTLGFRDRCKRIVRHENGEVVTYSIPRHQCDNPRCKKLHRMLPAFMVPFKHYSEEIISDAVTDRLDPEINCEPPSLPTITRWKQWIALNRTDIDGQLKSIGYRELGFSEELLRSSASLLEVLINTIPCGWLHIILCMIYNSGGVLTPFCPEKFLPTLFLKSAESVVCSP